MGSKAYLVLENGKRFQGERFGAQGDVVAEVVFTTGMTGYLETLTDPSYHGQIVAQTFPLIGNYGVIPADFESSGIGPKAYLVKQWCQEPSNFRSEGDLDTFFKAQGVVGLSGIDTRALTKTIREKGVMNGIITDDPEKVDLEAVRAYRITGAVEAVSTQERYTVGPETAERHIALLDFGLKRNIWRELVERGARVTVCPCHTTAREIAALRPDGIMLSNGPGDPADCVEIIAEVKKLYDSGLPIFAICLGHQLMALANGATTRKMRFGHRGANHPVKDLKRGRCFITSQNHGYVVEEGSIDPAVAAVSHVNVNDGSLEGLRYLQRPVLTVQFHPEASPGPVDTDYLFQDFIDLIRETKEGGRTNA